MAGVNPSNVPGTGTAVTGVERINDTPLYDVVGIDATSTSALFFAQGINDTDDVLAVRKNDTFTNLLKGGELSKGQNFLVEGISLYIEQPFGDGTDLPQNVAQFFDQAVLIFKILDAEIYKCPAVKALGGVGFSVFSDDGAGVGDPFIYAQGGMPNAATTMRFKAPFRLTDNQSFSVEVKRRSALGALITTDHTIGCILHGTFAAPIQ
jgi:hypothetical protein